MRTHKIGIIICHRYATCAGGKCLRALREREGAFRDYGNDGIDLVGYVSCGGCPGGNVEYAPAEMIRNGVEVIHLATGLVVGYPPCPRLWYFVEFLKKVYHVEVRVGTHPIPQKYYANHACLGTYEDDTRLSTLAPIVCDERTRLAYD